MSDFETLSKAVETGDDKKVLEIIKAELDQGTQAIDVLEKGLIPGVQSLGKLFKDGQVYLPEILISVRAMNRGAEQYAVWAITGLWGDTRNLPTNGLELG